MVTTTALDFFPPPQHLHQRTHFGQNLSVANDNHTIPGRQKEHMHSRHTQPLDLYSLTLKPAHMADEHAQPLPLPHPTHFARVRATLSRRGSLRNPMPWCSLERTQERMMKSFSRPWKASTLATSSSCRDSTQHHKPTQPGEQITMPVHTQRKAPSHGTHTSRHAHRTAALHDVLCQRMANTYLCLVRAGW